MLSTTRQLVFACVLPLAVIAQIARSPARATPPERKALVTTYAPILSKVIPAVVTVRVIGATPIPVEVLTRAPDGAVPPLPKPQMAPFRSGGTGVVVDGQSGLILTNNHVIEGASWIQVGLSDGRRIRAEIVGRDIGTDIAVLKIQSKDLPSLPVGDSDSVQVGDVVLAVGNPFGLEGTATMGIVSALQRTEVGHGAFEDLMQIDALINPGNSGGALVNLDGELIGITTAGGEKAGKTTGIGFVIPINMAKVVMSELLTAGRMRRGSTGLIVEDLPDEIAMPKDGGAIRGALVTRVLPNTSAAAAGIKPDDIVVSVVNKPVRSADEFTTRTVTVPLGSAIPVIVFSNGAGRSISLQAVDLVLEPEARPVPPDAGSIYGARVSDILLGNPLYGNIRGAQVVAIAPGSPAWRSGLAIDDVIVAIDDGPVNSVDQLLWRISSAPVQFRLRILRDNVPGWIRATR